MLRKFIHLNLLLGIMLLLASCGSQQAADQTNDQSAQNNPAVDTTGTIGENGMFVFKAYDLEGGLRDSREWVGKKPVVLNFWGTWCPPCRKEIPDLVKVYNEYTSDQIEMIGLAVRDSPENVRTFSEQNGMNWIMLMGDQNLGIRYGITGVPTTIFIDRNGNEIGRFVGPRDYQTFKDAFELALRS
ncbi:MAG: TlpA disulfide reductase family protein [Candidatus Zixiibacteriota bacterium]